ncbi:MAG: 16S rRNA (uracil(1498)-N(3))-methyltransferase [Clostridia bacterium]|nr:16S rRNA (uracil(1498)-N(3))-methyltransferase [Clostridia bacterium]
MSAPRRFLLENKIDGNTEVLLEGEQFNHAKNVLRLGEGAEVVLLDGSGMEYSAIITSVSRHAMSAHIVGSARGEREASTPVYLLCGALKGDKTELVVQKAVELGVHKIGVFNSKFCSAFMNGGAKLERLNKVAREATKQCMRSVAPEVVYFDKLEDALASCSGYNNKLFACEFYDHSDADMLNLSGSSALVVGSEGGFAEEEFALAQNKYGFKGITLGKRILRAETAAVSLTAIVMFLLGEMG